MNAFCFVDKVSTKTRKYSYSFDSQICSSLTEQRIGHRTYKFRLISLLTTGRYHKDNHSILQEASAVNLFDSDRDNSIVYEDISLHYSDVIMTTIASQITSLTVVYTTVYSDADQRKHQSSASLAFVWGIHRRPVNSPHKGPVTRKMFPFDDVIMVVL